MKLKPISLLSGSQSKPTVESYLFCSAMYSTRSTTTGRPTLLLICRPRRVAIAELATAVNERSELIVISNVYGYYAVIQLAEG